MTCTSRRYVNHLMLTHVDPASTNSKPPRNLQIHALACLCQYTGSCTFGSGCPKFSVNQLRRRPYPSLKAVRGGV
ncbi:hypothetical protein Fmac_025937 [Flemingia macrophylla]|uniref:Uncharacterized protein n=1 Tax=Flemingia macrophylla TaxID=520843 RepID=A0ABD1LE06_9FABA